MAHLASTRTAAPARALEALESVAAAFGMDDDERRRFSEKRVARLIATLPFLAGCERPERTAAEHLAVYVLSVRAATRHLFYASPHDDRDVFERLRPIMRFEGGDARIIDRGMAMLARSMVEDYRRDAQVDQLLGKYNPVASGAWDAEQLDAELVSRIAAVESSVLDDLPDDGDLEAWWTWY